MPRPLIELIIALLVGVLCIVGFFEATEYRGASGYLPKTVLVLGFVLSAIWALQSALWLRRTEWSVQRSEGRLGKLLVFMGLVLAYVVIIPMLGFFTSTLVFVPSVIVLLGYRKRAVVVAAPLVFVAVLYLLFGLVLQVQLPEELLLQLAGTN